MARRYGSSDSMIGAKLAPRIALLVKHVMDEHLRQSGHHRAKIGAQAAIQFFRTITDERDVHAADLIAHAIGHDDTPPEVEKLLKFIHKGSGELSALLSHSLISSAVGTSIGAGLANILAPANQAIMHAAPAQIPGTGEVAAAAAAHLTSTDNARQLISMWGFNGNYADLFIELAHQYPAFGQAIEMLRRGLISQGEVEEIMRRSAIPERFFAGMIALKRERLGPADAALAALRGNISEDEAAGIAEINGIDRHDFDILVANTGEPPGAEQMMEALRRGLIDDARFERAIRQSRIRNEWIDVMKGLRFQPASPADAIRGAVQGHISVDQAKKIALEGSLREQDFQWMYETAGNPPGMMTMVQLWRRGEATQAEVEAAIREGRTKNKYIPNLVHLKRELPPQRTVVSMLTHGAITEAEAARMLHEHGYDDVTVKGYLKSATSSQSTREKLLAKGEILELFYDHAIAEAEALKLLHALGYSQHNAKLAIMLTTLKRERAIQQAAMSPIRSAYIGRHIDEPTARVRLDGVGVPAQQRDFALRLWAVDREAHTKQLTEAQIVKANTNGLLSDTQAEDRLLTLGYDKADARLLLDMEKGRTTPAP